MHTVSNLIVFSEIIRLSSKIKSMLKRSRLPIANIVSIYKLYKFPTIYNYHENNEMFKQNKLKDLTEIILATHIHIKLNAKWKKL